MNKIHDFELIHNCSFNQQLQGKQKMYLFIPFDIYQKQIVKQNTESSECNQNCDNSNTFRKLFRIQKEKIEQLNIHCTTH